MQPDLILIPFGENATPGTIDPIPETRGPGDDPQQATWNEGFPLVTMTPLGAGGIPPKGQDFNGVLKAISEHTVFTGRGGQYKWSTAYVAASGGYSIGDVIQDDGGLNSYVSLVNTNTANFNTTPAAIGVSWALYAGRNTQIQATETVSGIAEIATQAEVTTGADDARIVTPAKLRGAQATQAEAEAGTDNTKLMTPLRARQQRDKAGFAIDTGTANTYVCAFTPAITVRIEGQVLKFKVKTANTGASTLNDGVGAVALVGGAQTALQGGELIANGDAWVQWNTSVGGGSYILLFCTGAAEQVAPAIKSQHAIQLGQVQEQIFGFINKFANGAFRTNQRGYVSGTALAAGVPSTGVGYGHDGFRAGAGGLTYTFTQSLGPTQITITAGTGIMTAEDASIEGGVYLLSWPGTAQARVGINNAAPSGAYASSPILIPAANAGQAISAEFNAGTLGTVQLKSGTVQVPFEWPDPQAQLARCQRYLPVIGPSSTGVNGVIACGQCITTQQAVFPIPLKVTPRTPPTGLTAINPASFQASNAGYVGATTSSVILYGTTSNSMVGVQVVTSGAALVAGNASTLLSVAAGAQLIFTGAEI